MFGSKILPTILIIVPATVLLSAQASLSEPAAEECKAGPGTNTPRGAHWYYRINRAKQHCWYLGVADGHANAAAVTPAASTAASTPQKGNAAGATRTAAAAPAAPAAPALDAGCANTDDCPPQPPLRQRCLSCRAAPGFVTRWPENLPSAEDLDQQEPAATTNSYAEGREATEQAGQQTGQMAPKWPLAAADRALPAVRRGGAPILFYSRRARYSAVADRGMGGEDSRASRAGQRSRSVAHDGDAASPATARGFRRARRHCAVGGRPAWRCRLAGADADRSGLRP